MTMPNVSEPSGVRFQHPAAPSRRRTPAAKKRLTADVGATRAAKKAPSGSSA
ncbi:MAG: hypothetical protein R3E97_17530 [Candidatus Eisenbacteria bacterium]